MPDGPCIVAAAEGLNGFRVVRFMEGGNVVHVLEVPDGCDALGVEKWREFQINSVHLKSLFAYFLHLVNQLAEYTNAKDV